MKPKCFCSLQLGLFVLLLSSIIKQIGRFSRNSFCELIESTVTISPKNSGLGVGLAGMPVPKMAKNGFKSVFVQLDYGFV
jgi:hypothetical protein